MLEANHKKWAEWIFRKYTVHILEKTFGGIYLINDIPEVPEDKSLLITPNHSSWWDGFYNYYLCMKYYPRKVIHGMQLEEQLRNYPFFRKIGHFSVDPGKPKSLIRTLNYARSILSDPANLMVIFPQGELTIFGNEPLQFKRGIQKFIEHNNSNIVILPLAFKIQYDNRRKPDIFLRAGNLLNAAEVNNNYELFISEFLDNYEKMKSLALDKHYKKEILFNDA